MVMGRVTTILVKKQVTFKNSTLQQQTTEQSRQYWTHSDFKRGIMQWVTPYARRQYWEIRTAYQDVNPRATWKWVHVAKSKYQEKWVRQAARLMGVKS